MAMLREITRFLDQLLEHGKIQDSAYNGLQVEARQVVKKVGFAVDAAVSVFQKAKDQNCELLIVHHGILWGSTVYPVTGLMRNRIGFLLKNNLSLYASHLPLDLHPLYGNNVQLVHLLGLCDVRAFGDYKGTPVGFIGELEQPYSLSAFVEKVNILLGTKSKVLSFGKKEIHSVAIVSGGGASTLPEAIDRGADVLLVGEFSHVHYHLAKEGTIHLVAAGHYATETLGVEALMQVLKEKFDVETVFIDEETGL